jgi:glycosyltransferase involved in cell wall biosynthesis
MRILVYDDSMFSPHAGSANRFMRELAQALAEAGEQVTASYGSNGGAASHVAGCRSIPFSHRGREQVRPFRFAGMSPSLDTILGSASPDLFIGLVWDRWQFPYLELPRDLPVVQVSPHGAFCDSGRVGHVFTSGTTNLRRLRLKGVENASLLYNPLPVPPVKNRGPNQPLVFGRSGRPDPAIFDPISLQAWAIIEQKGLEARYVYVSPCQQARELSSRLNLRNVTFLEWLNERELAAFYQAIDIFAHARSDGETMGIAIAEAMLAQCPIVTHRSRFHNEHLNLIDARCGFVASIGNVEAYAGHLEWCIRNPAALLEMGAHARARARAMFDSDLIWPEIIEIIRAARQASPRANPRRWLYNTFARMTAPRPALSA